MKREEKNRTFTDFIPLSALNILTQSKIHYSALWAFVIDLRSSADQWRGWTSYRILPVLSAATYNIWLPVEGKKGKHASENDCWSQVRIKIGVSLSFTNENRSMNAKVKEDSSRWSIQSISEEIWEEVICECSIKGIQKRHELKRFLTEWPSEMSERSLGTR